MAWNRKLTFFVDNRFCNSWTICLEATERPFFWVVGDTPLIQHFASRFFHNYSPVGLIVFVDSLKMYSKKRAENVLGSSVYSRYTIYYEVHLTNTSKKTATKKQLSYKLSLHKYVLFLVLFLLWLWLKSFTTS